MAKAKDLAALAGLAGLAYAYNNRKSKGDKDDAGDQKTSSYTGDTKKVEDKDEPRRKIEDYQKKAPEAEDANYGNEGRRTSMGVAPAAKSASKPAPAKQAPSDRRTLESDMSRGTRAAAPKNPDYSNEGRSSTAPSKNPDYSNEGRSSTAPTMASKVGNVAKDAVKTVAKTAVQGPAGAIATAAKPVADKVVAASGYKVPTSEEAAANRQAVYDKVKGVGSSVVDYVKNFETPAERRSREAKESKDTSPKARTDSPLGRKMESEVLNNMITNPPMKKGGMVKMASGGVTASRRADGIAQRGKTRGKIC